MLLYALPHILLFSLFTSVFDWHLLGEIYGIIACSKERKDQKTSPERKNNKQISLVYRHWLKKGGNVNTEGIKENYQQKCRIP